MFINISVYFFIISILIGFSFYFYDLIPIKKISYLNKINDSLLLLYGVIGLVIFIFTLNSITSLNFRNLENNRLESLKNTLQNNLNTQRLYYCYTAFKKTPNSPNNFDDIKNEFLNYCNFLNKNIFKKIDNLSYIQTLKAEFNIKKTNNEIVDNDIITIKSIINDIISKSSELDKINKMNDNYDFIQNIIKLFSAFLIPILIGFKFGYIWRKNE